MNEKSFLTPEYAPDNVKISVSTRYGGYSEKPYDSLNLGLYTGDSITSVIKNFACYKKATGIGELITLKQVHGTDILEVTEDNSADILLEEADGLFTRVSGISIGVVTADCIPVIITGDFSAAALHCGWRGLNAGIIDKAFGFFKSYGDAVRYAYIGVGICSDCYEVKDDLVSCLNVNYRPETALKKKNDFSYNLDLKRLTLNALVYNGLEQEKTEISPLSSCCSDGFFSYRKSGGITGRMVTSVEIIK